MSARYRGSWVAPVTLALVLSGLSASAHADDLAASVVAGERVRVSAPGVERHVLTGSVMAVDADAISVRPDGRTDPVRVPRAAIEQLQFSDGPGSRGLHAFFGALTGGLVGLAAGAKSSGWFKQDAEAAGFTLGALAGGLVGVALPRGERWRDAPAPRRVQIVPRPDLGAGIGIRVGL